MKINSILVKQNILLTSALTLVLITSCSTSTNNDSKANTDSIVKNKIETKIDSIEPIGNFRGVDVSRWNGDAVNEIDASDSISFIICKATEGITGIDPEFSKNWKMIKDKG